MVIRILVHGTDPVSPNPLLDFGFKICQISSIGLPGPQPFLGILCTDKILLSYRKPIFDWNRTGDFGPRFRDLGDGVWPERRPRRGTGEIVDREDGFIVIDNRETLIEWLMR